MAGIVKLRYTIGDSEYSSSTVFHMGSLSFDPLAFLLLLFYCLINRRNILKLFFASEVEQTDKSNKQIDFYYSKFNSYTHDELNDIFKMFKDYPPEAQLALRRIHEEKNLSFLTTIG
jgi:hypothetical protein